MSIFFLTRLFYSLLIFSVNSLFLSFKKQFPCYFHKYFKFSKS